MLSCSCGWKFRGIVFLPLLVEFLFLLLRLGRGVLHNGAARVLLFGGGVEHLALGAEVGALGYQVVEFLATLEDLRFVFTSR